MNVPTLLTCGLLLAIPASLSAQEPRERLILKGDTDPVRTPYQFNSIVFSHDGKTIATVGAGIKLWDSSSGMLKQTLKTKLPPYTVAFSPDDKLVGTGAGAYGHGDIAVWQVATGEPVWQQRDVSDYFFVPVIFAADGKALISPENSTWSRHTASEREALPVKWALTFWHADTGKRGRILEGGQHDVSHLALSADGKRLFTATRGYPSQHVELWDVPAGKLMGKVAFEKEGIIAVSLATDTTAAIGLRDRIEFWDIADGKLLRTVKIGELYLVAFATPLAFSADGKLLASALENEVKLWDTQTGALKGSLRLAKTFCLALSPDGKTLATTNQDGMVRLWETATLAERK